MAIEFMDFIQTLVVGGGGGAATWFAIRRMARADDTQNAAAKIDVQSQEGLLQELQHWQELGLQVGPLRAKLAHDEARLTSLGVMLRTVHKMLCVDCIEKNRTLIGYIEHELDMMVPVRVAHEPLNPLDLEVRAAVEQFMLERYGTK